MYSLIISCNVTTFTEVDQVEEDVNLGCRQNFKNGEKWRKWRKLVL